VIPRRLPWTEQTWRRLPPLAARGVHAVLLHGQRGIGKTSLALDFAEAALCAAPLADRHRCGRCDECRLTEAFSHPDLRWVMPQALSEQLLPQPEPDDSNEGAAEGGESDGKAPKSSREIRVEQVRALSDFLGLASFRGGRRAVLIAPVETMNAVAANTLLKMLEEPPPETLFVLVAHALDDVLPTIRSRCVLVQVPVPDPQPCLSWLAGQGVAEPAAALALASGAPLAAGAGEAASGGADAAVLYRLLDAGPSLTEAQIVAAVGRDAHLPAAVRLLQCWAFDLLACRMLRTVRYHPQRAARIARIAESANADRLWNWISSLRSAAAVREHPLNARLVIESLLVSYAQIFAGPR
jgi:DNA polymerase-3 subunit delta'